MHLLYPTVFYIGLFNSWINSGFIKLRINATSSRTLNISRICVESYKVPVSYSNLFVPIIQSPIRNPVSILARQPKVPYNIAPTEQSDEPAGTSKDQPKENSFSLKRGRTSHTRDTSPTPSLYDRLLKRQFNRQLLEARREAKKPKKPTVNFFS